MTAGCHRLLIQVQLVDSLLGNVQNIDSGTLAGKFKRS
jgi:hypothetical protein